jgi:hypothetical protein
MRIAGWIAILSGLFVLACSGGDGKAEPTVSDVPLDAVSDSGPDAPSDTTGGADEQELIGPEIAVDLVSELADDLPPDACVSECQDKQCGDNGCGGTCGECGDNELCSDEGQCVFKCTDSKQCAEDQYCLDEGCVDDICTPETLQCNLAVVEVCNAEGSAWETQEECQEGFFCEDGLCHEQSCSPGYVKCDGDLLMVCDSLGKQMELSADCSETEQFCFEGQCIGTACIPGQSFCEDGVTLAVCEETGMEYLTQTCPEGTFCATGECIDWICEPGVPVCDGFSATLCEPDGSGPVEGGEDCSLQGKFCSNGECTKCFSECFGKACGNDGCGGSCGDCNDGNPCTTEQCDEATFLCLSNEVPDCCLTDDECEDDDACTVDSCQANLCQQAFICCDSHAQCDDGDDTCTHDLCLNSFCWHKPIPDNSCCPKFAIYEGFESQTLPGWNLSATGNKKWAVSEQAPYDGAFALACTKAEKTARATLPGPLFVPTNGAQLQFQYRTNAWNQVDCQTMGLHIEIDDLPADLICEPASEWTLYSLDLTPWAGLNVVIAIQYLMDDKDNPEHAIYVDELKVTMPCCAEDADCDDAQFCTTDSCDSHGACVHETDPACCQPALLQEDFESGTALHWTLFADDKDKWTVESGNAHIGMYALEAHHDDSQAITTLPATYQIPTNGGALKFWYRSFEWNLVEWGVDGVTVLINGAIAEVITVPVDDWTTYFLDLGPWAGQEISIQLKYSMGAQGNENNKVVIDDVQVVKNCCEEDGECDDGNGCTADSCGLWGACVNDLNPECCQPFIYTENFDSGVAWQWSLSDNNQKLWAVSDVEAASGETSLNGNVWHNGATATLPEPHFVPVGGLTLVFQYKTIDWNVLDCAVDGIAVVINGHVEGRACQPSPDGWLEFAIGLEAWAGHEVTVQLKYNIVSGGNGSHQAFVDDVQLLLNCCQEDAECDDGLNCTQDSCTEGVCANSADAACCGDPMLLEGFEQSAWNWTLGNSPQATWVLADEGFESFHSITASQWSGNPVAHVPGLYEIPVSGAILSFSYKTANWNALDCGHMGIQVWVNGQRIAVACEAHVEDWGEFAVDLSAFGGQTAKIVLRYLVGADGNYANQAWVDSVRIDPICCDEDSECDDQHACTIDSCSGGTCLHSPEEGCCEPGIFAEDFDAGTAWGWDLSYGTDLAWSVSDEGSADGSFSLSASWAVNTAQAKFPLLDVVPYTGGYALFWYRTEGWLALDCNWMGVTIRVNGEVADVLCQTAEDWTMYTVDLFQWAGSSPEITLTYHVGNNGNPAHRIFIDDLQVIYECP